MELPKQRAEEEEADTKESSARKLVRDAIFTYASTLTSAFTGVSIHRTLSQEDSPIKRLAPEVILDRLGDEARQQFAEAERAASSLKTLDLHAVAEKEWAKHARKRDEALQACAHLEEARLAGMRAQERRHKVTGHCAQAARQFDSIRADKIRGSRRRLEALTEMLERRIKAEALLDELGVMQAADGKLRQLRKNLRNAKNLLEDLEESLIFGDPRLQNARGKVERCQREFDSEKLRRDAIITEIADLSGERKRPGTKPIGTAETAEEEGQETEAEGNNVMQAGWGITGVAFPDLPVRAHKLAHPYEAYEVMKPEQKARADMHTLLARAGLLACERSYDSYDMSQAAVPQQLRDATGSKPNVNGAWLRGVEDPELAMKVLKEFNVDEFKRVQRAISLAGRVNHPGFVKVECVFLEKHGTTVVVQMPYHAGGDLRAWAKRHYSNCFSLGLRVKMLKAAQRVSEAVAALHDYGFLHRDLKPENIVFHAEGEDAVPALCDFDLATPVSGTLPAATTQMRGTLLYMPPDHEPSRASDVYALGVTLLDAFIFNGDLPVMLGGLLDLERVQTQLHEMKGSDGASETMTHVLELMGRMVAQRAEERPSAREVADEMARLLEVRTCCVCSCPESKENGLVCGNDGGSARDAFVIPDARHQQDDNHFCCDDCFSLFVSTQLDAISADCRAVTCPSGQACAHTISLNVALSHATPESGNALLRNIESLMHNGIREEVTRLMREHREKLARMPENKRLELQLRKEIEDIVELRCPNLQCGQVFVDFDGCLALTCSNDRCRENFCGLCLQSCDSDSDAHKHVKECTLNPTKGYFMAKDIWQRNVGVLIRKRLQDHWQSLKEREQIGDIAGEVLDAVGADAGICAIFRDQGLQPPVQRTAPKSNADTSKVVADAHNFDEALVRANMGIAALHGVLAPQTPPREEPRDDAIEPRGAAEDLARRAEEEMAQLRRCLAEQEGLRQQAEARLQAEIADRQRKELAERRRKEQKAEEKREREQIKRDAEAYQERVNRELQRAVASRQQERRDNMPSYVIITQTGGCWHTSSSCPSLSRSRNLREVSSNQASSLGLRQCSRC